MKDTIKRLLGYVGKYKYPAFLTIFCMIGEVVFEVLIPKYMALLIDNGISLGDTGYVYRMGGVMILLTLGAMALGMLGVIFGAVGSVLVFSLRMKSAVFIIAGGLVILIGLQMWGIPFLRKLRPGLPSPCRFRGTPFLIGVLTGIMPCGILSSMWLVAASAASSVGRLTGSLSSG